MYERAVPPTAGLKVAADESEVVECSELDSLLYCEECDGEPMDESRGGYI